MHVLDIKPSLVIMSLLGIEKIKTWCQNNDKTSQPKRDVIKLHSYKCDQFVITENSDAEQKLQINRFLR